MKQDGHEMDLAGIGNTENEPAALLNGIEGDEGDAENVAEQDQAAYYVDPVTGEPLIGHRLTVTYLGSPFYGWQRQGGRETAQGCVERAIAKLWGREYSVQGSGRTDAGVHALAQVASFRAPRRHTAEVLMRAMNNNMPESIRVIGAELVPVEFHARFDSTGKTYHYHLLNAPLIDPFRQHLCFHVQRPLDVPLMRAAAVHLLGMHDFSTFASNPGYSRTTMVRTMHSVELEVTEAVGNPDPRARNVILKVTADGFLYRMVRNIVGALIKVGHAKMTPEHFREILASATRTAAPNTAPAHGLYMAHVFYGDELPHEMERRRAKQEARRNALPSIGMRLADGPMLWEGSAAHFAALAANPGTPVAPVKYGVTSRPRK